MRELCPASHHQLAQPRVRECSRGGEIVSRLRMHKARVQEPAAHFEAAPVAVDRAGHQAPVRATPEPAVFDEEAFGGERRQTHTITVAYGWGRGKECG